MGGLLDNNKLILRDAKGEDEHRWTLTLTPAATWVLAVVSLAGTDGMKSVVLVMIVDVEVAGPGPHIESGEGFLDLKTFL